MRYKLYLWRIYILSVNKKMLIDVHCPFKKKKKKKKKKDDY